MQDNLRKIKNTESLITYFAIELGWDIDLDDFEDVEDITYDFDAKDLGLKDEAFAKINSLRQLRPLVDGQRWGVFFVDFDSAKFEVAALRKILSGLIPNRRNSANHAVWDRNDLLFVCTWGGSDKFTLGIAHFEEAKKGLPQIKMISCEPAVEDFTQLASFRQKLEKLHWPEDPHDFDSWCEQWDSAFTVRYRQVIQDSHTLAVRLAEEARKIRDVILDTLDVETDNGYVHRLLSKFRDTLVHDMSERDFADMYAQTIVYGLFSARCMDDSQDDFSAKEAVDCIPSTNPFLKSLMKECFEPKRERNSLSFDELGVGDIVNLLLHTNTDGIIADFNRQTGGGREDPVIHFYEEFLAEYDKSQRVQRGVFYTPQPVVDFIVRSVDDILKNKFGHKDGLASTETKKLSVTRRSKKRIDGQYRSVSDEIIVPAVQVLDPATGTGTFIRQTILQVYKNFRAARKGMSEDLLQDEWNEYVPMHLLPRLNAFELMMAPYAVAHMKLAMVLKDTGYRFEGDARLQVYLTNSLEEAGGTNAQMTLFDDPLALESIEANRVKVNKGVNVIIGNPPYAGASSNKGDWIMGLIEAYKKEPNSNEQLKERNPKWINDDYVKFVRLAEKMLENSDMGVLAYINPHGFLDAPTFRGVRWSLLSTFDEVYVLNLHGNANRGEVCPDGSQDENVFDIQQGVSINIFVKSSAEKKLAKVHYMDLYGKRSDKYAYLSNHSLSSVEWETTNPIEPFYFMTPLDSEELLAYQNGVKLTELFPINVMGFQSHRDKFAVSFTREEMERRLHDMQSTSLSDEDLAAKYSLKDNRDWHLSQARARLRKQSEFSYLTKCIYRPFDARWCYLDTVMMDYPRTEIVQNCLGKDNFCLLAPRQQSTEGFRHAYVTNLPAESCALSTASREGNQVFPLWLYKGNMIAGSEREANLDKKQVAKLLRNTGMHMTSNSEKEGCRPEDILYYCLAILSAETYRASYSKYLKSDYPSIVIPPSRDAFVELSGYGKSLSDLFCLKEIGDGCVSFNGQDAAVIEGIKRKGEAVWINKIDYFDGISERVWQFKIGGHQPAQLWLKQRKGLALGENDMVDYQRLCASIDAAIGLMDNIELAYKRHFD